MNFKDALVAIHRGRAIVILGAGFSLGAKAGDPPETMPDGKALAAALLTDLGSDETLDYGLASDLYSKTHGEEKLREFLKGRLTAASTTAQQTTIASAPWRRIYTTNFDNVIEVAANGLHPIMPVTPHYTVQELPRDKLHCVHLHGYIFETPPAGLSPFPLILTRSSYIEPVLQRTNWPTQLQLDIEAADAVFIIGYSVADFHIARLLRTSPSNVRKTHIVLETNPSPALSSYLSQFGSVNSIGLEGFESAFQDAIAEVPAIESDNSLICFEEILFPESVNSPTTENVVALLSLGTVSDQNLGSDILNNNPPYTFPRNYALNSINSIKDGKTRFLIQSRIGNGKTIFLKQLHYELVRNGYRVFSARHVLPDAGREIAHLINTPGRKAFFFDGYRDYQELLRSVGAQASPNDVIVASVRTSEVNYVNDPSSLMGGSTIRISLDSLTDTEVRDLDNLIHYYGLWGGRGASSPAARQRIIRENCDRELRAVILYLFENTPLGDRVRGAFNDLKRDAESTLLAFTGSLLARLADCPIDFYDVCELLEADHFETRDQLRKAGAGEFFHIADDDFRARSAVLADFSVSRIVQPETCLAALVKMVESLTELYGADERYEASVPRLLRFSVISRVFRGSIRRDFIIRFYESMLGLGKIRTNPQFWVQYAMARMERREFKLADTCLENAYGEARKLRRYDMYMIDNQKTKLLFNSRIDGNGYSDIDSALIEALTLTRRQIDGMNRVVDIHVLRLADPMREYLMRFSEKLKPENRESLVTTMQAMRDRVLQISPENRLDDEERRLFQKL